MAGAQVQNIVSHNARGSELRIKPMQAARKSLSVRANEDFFGD